MAELLGVMNWKVWFRDYDTHEQVLEVTDSVTNGGVGLGVSRRGRGRLDMLLPLNIADFIYDCEGRYIVELLQLRRDGSEEQRLLGPAKLTTIHYEGKRVPTAHVEFEAADEWLDFRYSFRSQTELPEDYDEDAETSYEEEELTLLAARIIRNTNTKDGPTWLRAYAGDQGEGPTGLVAKNGYWKNVGDAIEELADSEPGIEWHVIPEDGEDSQGKYLGRFVSAGKLGEPRPEVIFEYRAEDGNLDSADDSFDTSGIANRIAHVQAGEDPYVVEDEDEDSQARFGTRDMVIGESIKVPRYRKTLVDYYKVYAGDVRKTVDGQPATHQSYGTGDFIPFLDYSYGDTVGFRIYHPERPETPVKDVSVRVYSVDVSFESNGKESVKLGLFMGS